MCMRRARLLGIATAAAALVVVVLAASSQAVSDGIVAKGTFGTVPWTLAATDSADGQMCLTMTLPQRLGGGSTECGTIFGHAPGDPRGITYLAHSGAPVPDYIVGPVTARAKTVVIALSTGKTIKTRTIAPPRGMTAKIAFYVTALACPARATSVRGLDASGHVVAHLTIRLLPQLRKASC